MHGRFWRYQVRYRVARWLMHVGLIIWPPGPAKAEVMLLLWEWRWQVEDALQKAASNAR